MAGGENRNTLKKSSNIALAGVFSSIALLIMFLTGVFPMVATFVLPAIAGSLFIILYIELGFKMAFQAYLATAILALFIVPDREAALFFIFFFGHYPLLRAGIDRRIKNRVLNFIVKLVFFNICFAFIYALIWFIFGLEYLSESFGGFKIWAMAIYFGLGNFTFLLYDFCLSNLEFIYTKMFRKKLLKFFK